jgi:hypothetical protein
MRLEHAPPVEEDTEAEVLACTETCYSIRDANLVVCEERYGKEREMIDVRTTVI